MTRRFDLSDPAFDVTSPEVHAAREEGWYVETKRMPDAVPDGPGEWLPVSGDTGAVRCPIRFTPGH